MTLYYATARKGRQTMVLAGPFRRRTSARAAARRAPVVLSDRLSSREHFDVGWGVTGSDEHLAARHNDTLGLTLGPDGLVVCKPDDVVRTERRRSSRAARRARDLALHARSFCGWCGSKVPEGRRKTNLHNSTPSFCDDGCARSYFG